VLAAGGGLRSHVLAIDGGRKAAIGGVTDIGCSAAGAATSGMLYVGYWQLVVLIGGRLHAAALGSGHIDASRGAAASGWPQTD
jgi:hypothetical protein